MCWRVPATALKSYTSNTGCLAAGNKRTSSFVSTACQLCKILLVWGGEMGAPAGEGKNQIFFERKLVE